MKPRITSALAISLASVLLSLPAHAQTTTSQQRNKTFEDSNERLRVNRPNSSALEELGYVIGDGVILSPTINAEVGYDSNPDKLWVEEDSAFARVDGGLVLGFVQPNQAVTLALKGRVVEYEGLDRSTRWDAGFIAEAYKRFENGFEISGSAHHLHDEVSLTKNEATAASYNAQYANDFLEAYGRGIVHQVRNLSQEELSNAIAVSERPYYYTWENNLLRAEQTAGLLINKNERFSPYIEGGYASIDYIDQKIAHLINKDAREYWGIAGVRVTIAPQIRADIGYRYNRRDLDDQVVKSYETDYVDARVTWSPVPNLRAQFEVDRKIKEGISIKSRLSDVTSWGLSVQYKATPRTLFNLRALQRHSKDVGQAARYRDRLYLSETTYDINNKTQFYLSTLWQQMKEHVGQSSFNTYSIGLGIKVKYNGAKREPWGSLREELKAIPLESKRIGASLEYNYMILPKMQMTTVTDPFLRSSDRHITDHNGHVDGVRLSLDLAEMTAPNVLGETHELFNVKGFFGRYFSKDVSTCNYTSSYDCVFVNVKDMNLADDNNTGAFGRLLTKTKRTVHHWGAALEAPVIRTVPSSSMKDSRSVVQRTPWRFGIAVKAIEQDIDLHAIDTSVPDPIDYREELDTYYYGIYASYNKRYRLRENLHLNVSAEGGLYFADTDYNGSYVAYYPIGGSLYELDRGSADDDYQQEAFIGSLKFDLVQQMNWGKLSLNGQAEYYSYAPKIQYNDNDLAGGGVLDLNGLHKGTSIDAGSAASFSLGGRVSIPLDKIIN